MSDFKQGNKVRIIDSEKKTDLIYIIKKIKKSQEGTTLYLLKSESSAVTLLYYESEKSHLEKFDDLLESKS